MTDAFQCDFCGNFKTERPSKTLYVEIEGRMQNPTYREEYHLCQQCSDKLDTDTSESND